MLVAHRVYGVPQTINTAYYVLFLAYKDILPSLKRTAITPSKDLEAILTGTFSVCVANEGYVTPLADELLSLHRGQGLDILWRDTLQCPSEEEYISMANGST